MFVDKAPTNRATCPKCKKLIPKDSVRVNTIEGAFNSEVHYHAACYVKMNAQGFNLLKEFILKELD